MNKLYSVYGEARDREANTVLKQKKEAGGQTLSHFKTYDKANKYKDNN